MSTHKLPGISPGEVKAGWTALDQVRAWQLYDSQRRIEIQIDTPIPYTLSDNEAAAKARNASWDAWVDAGYEQHSPFPSLMSRALDLAILTAVIVGGLSLLFIVGASLWFMIASAMGAA